jgi:hypothetical protein
MMNFTSIREDFSSYLNIFAAIYLNLGSSNV